MLGEERTTPHTPIGFTARAFETPLARLAKLVEEARKRSRSASVRSSPRATRVGGGARATKDPAVESARKAGLSKLIASTHAVDRNAERLWRAYRRRVGDETRNRLIEHYQPFVTELVRRLSARLPRNVDRGDLATAANVGLMAAIGGFDPTRGVRFEVYCELRVRGALLDELRSHDWLPRAWRARFELQRRVIERLRSEIGREPPEEDVAREMGMPIASYRHVFGLGLLDAPVGVVVDAEGETSPGLDVVADPHADNAGEKLSRDEILRLVAQKLTGQEYRLVYLKYWEELSMREIGELMRISESRVCKIHMRLLERLKDRFRVGADE